MLYVLYLGYTLTAAAKLLGTTQKTVSKWVKRYQETGKFDLLDAPRSGRSSSISPKLRDFVEKIARSDTAQYSNTFTNWLLQNIHRYLKEVFEENVSKSSIYRILKSSGFRFRMITETLVIQDPNIP